MAQNIGLQLGIAVQQMESVQEVRQESEKLASAVEQASGGTRESGGGYY